MERKPGLVHQPVFRVGLVLVLLVVVFVIAQQISVPKSFGEYGYYRGDSVQESADHELKYSKGSDTCGACHSDKKASLSKGEHAQISCESCHGPGNKHVLGPAQFKPVVDKTRDFCGVCHQKNASRPSDSIRQVDLPKHNVSSACSACHDPHQPWGKMGGKRP